ncbi:MAG: AAA family ATPase [Coriobacteriales bacterium]|jgi:predicted AAA+ superfamily ATPase|nr:AAA family ATPase [Coriobacteriales bacterium]
MYQRDVVNTLAMRFEEPRRFIQVLVGPRQVGKTTAIGQTEEQLSINPGRLVVVESADDMAAAGREWIGRVWEDVRTKMALTGAEEAVLVFDEIQKVEGWSEAVKRNWDKDTRDKRPLKVLLSGSSRMLIQEGLSESLFGRYEQLYLTHWSLSEMREAFDVDPEHFAFYGAYPAAVSLMSDDARFKSYVTASVIEASINRDIFLLEKIDKPALLRQLFELGVQYSGQILSYNKMVGQLQDAGNTTTLARYLHLLDQAGLLAGIDKFSMQHVRSRASSPKYQVHNNALLAAGQTGTFEDVRSDPIAWGRVVESAVGAHLVNEARKTPNCRIQYWNNGNREVDFVLCSGDAVVGIEVKSYVGANETGGLVAFKKEFPAAQTLLVGNVLSWQDILCATASQIVEAAG